MDYSNILEQLLLEFPELKESWNDNEHLQDLPHCFFDIVFVPFIVNACKNEKQELLVKVGDCLEQMAFCDDEKVRELLNVSVLEPLVLEKENMISFLKLFLKKETLKELEYWEKRYNK